jgi:hypothetical protein
MKIIIVLIGLLFASLTSLNSKNAIGFPNQDGRDSVYIVQLKDFYDGKGVIFSEKIDYAGLWGKNQRITPTLLDVKEAELILDSVIDIHYKNDLLKKNEFKNKVRKCNRQYFGFSTKSNEKIIEIYLFNFEDPRSIVVFEGWDRSCILSTEDFFWTNVRIYSINITTKELMEGSDPLEF